MMNEFTTALEKSDKTHWADTIQNENTRWSIEEDNVLRRFYPSEGSDVAYRLRGRTVASCQFRACKLGVNRIQPHKNGKWQADEDEILRTWYPKIGIRVADMLPCRTKSAIQNRATLFGLHKEYTLAPVGSYRDEGIYRRRRKLHNNSE